MRYEKMKIIPTELKMKFYLHGGKIYTRGVGVEKFQVLKVTLYQIINKIG